VDPAADTKAKDSSSSLSTTDILDSIDRTEKTNEKLEKENEMLHVYENNL
jgi:hypothetical protein